MNKNIEDRIMELKKGIAVGILCKVTPGPFAGERLITLESISGPLSGFVRDSELEQRGDQWHVRAIVESVVDDTISVWIRGSFFTTNGMATISRKFALAA